MFREQHIIGLELQVELRRAAGAVGVIFRDSGCGITMKSINDQDKSFRTIW